MPGVHVLRGPSRARRTLCQSRRDISKAEANQVRISTDLGSSVASASDTTPITATSTISGCCSRTLSSSAGGTVEEVQIIEFGRN